MHTQTFSRRSRSYGKHWMIAVLASERFLDASTGRQLVRPAFMEPLVDAIAKRHRAGWSVGRLTLWLRATLTDPQTGEVCVVAQRSFVAYVTGLLAGDEATATRGRRGGPRPRAARLRAAA
ncbi:hypothetical protein GCM10022222_42450 [Amycolatopsis ultiminotia]|uniref:Uncharacterized protein n=1 Tax=Amycolatopsis ultiminotia TaxID=543629 RepID=A0ABP6WNQ1_9PSEU